MAALDEEIREQLSRFLAGDIDLRAFRDWFVPFAWNIEKRANAGTAEVVHQIDLVLSEFEHGDWSEAEMRDHLVPLVQNSRVRLHETFWGTGVWAGMVSVSNSSALQQQRVQNVGTKLTVEGTRIQTGSRSETAA